MRKSFALACALYLPLTALAVWSSSLPRTESFKAAGLESAVTMHLAQLGGAVPATENEEPVRETLSNTPREAEPQPEPLPELVSESESSVAPQPRPEDLSKIEPRPEPKAKPSTVAKAKPRQESKPKTQPRSETPKATKRRELAETQASSAPQALTPSLRQNAEAPSAGEQTGIATLVYGEAEDLFLSEVKRRVEAALKYPRKARAMRMQGTAVAQFVVAKDGTISELAIISSSGHTLLDKTAIEAVEAAQPQWGAPKKTVRLRFPIRFHVRG